MNQALPPKDELQQEIVDLAKESEDHKGYIKLLQHDIASLEVTRQRARDDVEALNSEAELLENKIIDLDADFKDRETTTTEQLLDIQQKLKQALQSLHEAQREDKQIRQNWADEHIKHDKRRSELRHLEVKLGKDEKGVQSLDEYMKM